MRIVQAVGWYYPETLGGTEVYVQELGRRLVAAGHEVAIAAPDAVSPCERVYEHDGLPVFRYPIPRRATRSEAQGLTGVRGAERFHAWLAGYRPDLVHFHTFVTGLGLDEVRAANALGARVVVTTHAGSLGFLCQRGTMMRGGRRACDGLAAPAKCASCALEGAGLPRWAASGAGRVPPALGSMFRRTPGRLSTALAMSDLIERNLARQRDLFELADAFVVLTDWAARALIANGAPPSGVVVNRLGVGGSITRKPGPDVRPSKRPVRIGYLGRYDVIKGVMDLGRALAALPASVPVRAEFRGPLRSRSERDVAGRLRRLLGNDPRFFVGDEVPREHVGQMLSAFDVVCCPAICLEGGPTVALESRAVGTPVIGTRIGGLAEIVRAGVDGDLVEPGDWRAMSALVQRIASRPEEIDDWRRRIDAPRTMDAVAEEYLETYAGRGVSRGHVPQRCATVGAGSAPLFLHKDVR